MQYSNSATRCTRLHLTPRPRLAAAAAATGCACGCSALVGVLCAVLQLLPVQQAHDVAPAQGV
jgi:hypothetical protein